MAQKNLRASVRTFGCSKHSSCLPFLFFVNAMKFLAMKNNFVRSQSAGNDNATSALFFNFIQAVRVCAGTGLHFSSAFNARILVLTIMTNSVT